MTPSLAAIPVVDVREGGTLRHAHEGRERARGLRDTCVGWFPGVAQPFMPVLDRAARGWLTRSASPYVGEVESIAATVGISGVWLLNTSYQCCCTALARDESGQPWLARTLDWPFPGLGRLAEIAHMRGSAGDFYSITWPGYVGALTAMAPGRFAAAINQAPLWRRAEHPWLRPVDVALNTVATWRVRHIPPDQLLRQVFETCRTYAEAKERLLSAPIARPVIVTLVGCRPGERCVIERTEEGGEVRDHETSAANDWLVNRRQWEGRVSATRLLSCSSEEAAANSKARRMRVTNWRGTFARDSFAWIAEPVLNPYTRLAVEMCPAAGVMRVVGYERQSGAPLPQPATQVRELTVERAAA